MKPTLSDLLTAAGIGEDTALMICIRAMDGKTIHEPLAKIIVDAFMGAKIHEGNDYGWDDVAKDLSYAKYCIERAEAVAKKRADELKALSDD